MFEGKEELEKLMDELKLDMEFLADNKLPDSTSTRSLHFPMKDPRSDLGRSTFRRISTLRTKTVVFTDEEIKHLATRVDRKKLLKEARPVVRVRPPMLNPYSSDK